MIDISQEFIQLGLMALASRSRILTEPDAIPVYLFYT